MPNSLKSMIKKLAHKGCISSVECDELLTKLNGHDDKIRADERRKFAKECQYLLNCGMGKKKSLEHLIKILEKEQNNE